MRHHTKDKGDLGLLKVQCKMCELGHIVLYPLTEHSPFDFVSYKDGKLYRIQVKYRTLKNGCVTVKFSTSWADRNGTHTRYYNLEDIDVFAIYCPDTDKCYFIHVDEYKNHKCVTLRVEPAKNNQTTNVLLAEDFEKF